MAPKLHITVSDGSSYPPTRSIQVNTAKSTHIKTPGFEGEVRVWIKGFNGDEGDDEELYFGHYKERGEKRDLTYAISIRGTFNEDLNGDDLLFGNVFERPIKDHLPWGTSVAMRFTSYIDPTLIHDVYADKPWAMSPVLSCMSVLSLSSGGGQQSSKNQDVVLHEDSWKYFQSHDEEFAEKEEDKPQDRLERQKWFSSQERRERIVLTKGTEVGMEFSNGLVDFSKLSLNLPHPISMQIPLLQYWDGQPVIYVCRKRTPSGKSPVSSEGMLFSISFEIVDEEAIENLEAKGGSVLAVKDIGKQATGKKDDEDDKEEEEEEEGEFHDAEGISDDVD
ncbi:hypothetical protein BD324DRAFT_630814 [Kockovaella imperatae]|uniref:Domain of unknown function at the cortex 1 domain-containing protein n=1 Tax=Kockovaella imperatae TaxID=4999 RepID=A0A1Y1UC38_9TREE|nr:hypothetical protein BD324DRAFT_630814 [Kockovaella imperatae]ORX35601.1 hypothetical protein BD324DRAFT_630814 [Kockovaella imperatae]